MFVDNMDRISERQGRTIWRRWIFFISRIFLLSIQTEYICLCGFQFKLSIDPFSYDCFAPFFVWFALFSFCKNCRKAGNSWDAIAGAVRENGNWPLMQIETNIWVLASRKQFVVEKGFFYLSNFSWNHFQQIDIYLYK